MTMSKNDPAVIPWLPDKYTLRASSAMILGGNGRKYDIMTCL